MPVTVGGTTPKPISGPVVKPGTTVVDPRAPKYVAPKALIELPPNLGRPPKATDLIIRKGFDGLTPDAAVAKMRKALTGKVAPQNEALVLSTAKDRYRDFNVAMNNVFAPNSPNNQFVKSLAPAQVSMLGTMSSMTPVVYKAVSSDGTTKYYSRDWSGNFAEQPKAPTNVVMEAKVRVEPPGLVMSYPKWKNAALAGQLVTITEM